MSYLYHIYRENVYPTISSLFYILQTWFDNLPVTMWRRRQGAHALIFMSTEQGRNLYLNLGTLLDFWGNIVNHRPTCTRLLIIYLSVGATHMDFGVCHGCKSDGLTEITFRMLTYIQLVLKLWNNAIGWVKPFDF